ncbi:BapA prefix-like domain-containing protein [Acinetobacter thermotolerans]|uniref:BapA/Bap/LapF family prefix-like domain-containing protein n=1 Tax=Acinetobacter thermotolerans TaxID=3151487 RepID=UPI00325AAA67
MKEIQIINKDTKAIKQFQADTIRLDQGSIVKIKASKSDIVQLSQEGTNLVVILRNGEKLIIENFYPLYPEDLPSNLVIEDSNGTLYWFDEATKQYKHIPKIDELYPSSSFLGENWEWITLGTLLIGGLASVDGGGDERDEELEEPLLEEPPEEEPPEEEFPIDEPPEEEPPVEEPPEGENPENPGGENPENPGGENPENPGGENPENPGGENPENPGGENPENPGGENPENPGGENPENPGGENPENPGGENPENPGGENPENPENLENPGGGETVEPGIQTDPIVRAAPLNLLNQGQNEAILFNERTITRQPEFMTYSSEERSQEARTDEINSFEENKGIIYVEQLIGFIVSESNQETQLYQVLDAADEIINSNNQIDFLSVFSGRESKLLDMDYMQSDIISLADMLSDSNDVENTIVLENENDPIVIEANTEEVAQATDPLIVDNQADHYLQQLFLDQQQIIG